MSYQDFSILYLNVDCQATVIRCLKKASSMKKIDQNKMKQIRKEKKNSGGKNKARQRKQDNILKGFVCMHMCVYLYIPAAVKLCVLKSRGLFRSLQVQSHFHNYSKTLFSLFTFILVFRGYIICDITTH